MATVFHWSGSWTSGGDNDDLFPGETHPWWVHYFRPGDVISVTAFPVTGNPFATRSLAVRNLRTVGTTQGLEISFDVTNVGPDSIPGYFVNLAVIND
jgi:hypothetical protein